MSNDFDEMNAEGFYLMSDFAGDEINPWDTYVEHVAAMEPVEITPTETLGPILSSQLYYFHKSLQGYNSPGIISARKLIFRDV